MLKIDIGCGSNKKKGYIGIDKYQGDQVDIQLDITKQKLPFKDNSVDKINCSHILEHIVDGYENVIEEMHRTIKPSGEIKITTPFPELYTAKQPLHIRQLDWTAFDMYTEKNKNSLQSKPLFKIKSRKLTWKSLDLYGIIPKIADKNYYLYRRFLSRMFPAREIIFTLKKEG